MRDIGNSKEAVSIRDMNYAFGVDEARKQILFDVSADIRGGEIVILTGPSGSGKTTFLTLIGGLRSTQAGSLDVLGHELNGADERALTAAAESYIGKGQYEKVRAL